MFADIIKCICSSTELVHKMRRFIFTGFYTVVPELIGFTIALELIINNSRTTVKAYETAISTYYGPVLHYYKRILQKLQTSL